MGAIFKKLSPKQWTAIVFLSYCAAIAFSMSFAMPELPEEQKSGALTEIVWNFRNSLQSTGVNSTMLFGGFVGLGAVVQRIKKGLKQSRLLLPLSFLIAVVWLMGAGFHINNSLDHLTSSAGQVLKSVIYLTGSTYLLFELGQVMFWFLENQSETKTEPKGKLAKFYKKHPFWFSFAVIMILWLPHLIIAYPGYVCYDAWYQLCMYYDKIGFTTHQPPAHTVFLGLFTKLGLKMGHVNVGLYLSVIVQTLTAAFVMAYGMYLMKKWGTPRWLRILSFAVIGIVPFYTDYIALEIKDTFYSVFFLLFMLELICILEKGTDYFKELKHIILLFVSVIGTFLARNNGKYALYPTVILVLAYFLIKARKKDKKNFLKPMIRPLVAFIAPIIVANMFFTALINTYGVEQFGIREAMSLPFQQTARYVSQYGDEVTEEEAEAIRALIDYDALPAIYDPRFADPVKNTFKNESTTKDFTRYLGVWLKMFFKHPSVYVNATMNQNYYLLYPFVENDGGYDVIYTETVPEGIGGFFTPTVNGDLGITEVEGLQGAKMVVRGLYKSCFSLPVVGMFSHPAPYCIALLFLILFALKKKSWRLLIALFPLFVSAAVVVAAPVIQEHPRYTFPIIYSMPIIIAYYIHLGKPSEAK